MKKKNAKKNIIIFATVEPKFCFKSSKKVHLYFLHVKLKSTNSPMSSKKQNSADSHSEFLEYFTKKDGIDTIFVTGIIAINNKHICDGLNF